MAHEFISGLAGEWGEEAASAMANALCKRPTERSELLYALALACVQGEAPAEALSQVVGHEQVKALEHDVDRVHSEVGDVLWLLGLETEGKKEERDLLLAVTKPLLSLLPRKILQERLETDLLAGLKLLKSEKAYKMQYIRLNTRSYLTQTKYNLFQEETEGYAKLLETLNSSTPTKDLVVTVRSLIGQFDLDPNRVFDLILEAFECRIHEHRRFMSLFPLFRPDALRNLLGFKFQLYLKEKRSAPRSLYNLVAFLISKQAMSLSEIYPHLHPEDDSAKDARSAYLEEIAKKARRMESSMSLSDKGDDSKEAATLSEQVTLPSTCLDVESFGGVGDGEENQKIGLLVSILQVHDWKTASILLGHMRVLQPSQNREVCKALCQRVSILIRPLYAPIFKSLFGKDAAPLPNDLVQATRKVSPCESFAEIEEKVIPILYHLGPNICQDIVLFTKILRLVSHWYQKEPEAVPLEGLLSRVILPGLSGVPMNPNIASATWELLGKLPYTKRYQLYGQWTRKYDKHPSMTLLRAKARAEMRKVVKRISTDAGMIKKCGKILGKLSHSNPIIVFHELLINIERSPNMVQPTVDSLKYIGPLSHDVLTYVIVDRLAQPSKSKLKSDGKNIEEWLAGIAGFTGQFFRKFPSADLTGILQYVLNQLKAGNFTDLVILHELVVKMSGVDLIEAGLTKDQIEARAGGECLRSTVTPLAGGRPPKRQIKHLKDALVNNSFVVPLIVLMAQARTRISFETDTKSLKVLSQLFDKCHGTLVRFLEFIQVNVTPADAYIHMMPSLQKMAKTYHLECEIAFAVLRPVLPLIYDDAPHVPPGQESAGKVINYDEETEPDSFAATAKAMFPVRGWDCISSLYGTFWSLSLYDVYVPNGSYAKEIKKHHQALDVLNANRDQWDSHSTNAKELKKKKDYHSGMVVSLKEEQKQQRANHEALIQRLSKEKSEWLTDVGKDSRNEIIVQFLQTCVFPRCKFSVTDALFCARFVHILHRIGTPYFSTLQYFEKVTKDVASMIFACTENEANRFGIFLAETLELLHHWRSDKTIYQKECEPQPGFSISFSNPESARATYAEFAKVSFKWHCRLVKSFVTCLESKEYLEIRNALIILSKVVAHFPILKRAGQVIRDAVEKLATAEKRKDLKVLASSYLGMLENNKTNMISEADFKNEPVQAKKSEKQDRRSSMPGNASSTSTSSNANSTSSNSTNSRDRAAPTNAKERPSTPKQAGTRERSSTPSSRSDTSRSDSVGDKTSNKSADRTSNKSAERVDESKEKTAPAASRDRHSDKAAPRDSPSSAALPRDSSASERTGLSGTKRPRSEVSTSDGTKRRRESSKDRPAALSEPSQKKQRTSEDPQDPGKASAKDTKESPRAKEARDTRGRELRESGEIRESRSSRSSRTPRGSRDSNERNKGQPREGRRGRR